jgi:tetratricopeptide (TPR) repeat protein
MHPVVQDWCIHLIGIDKGVDLLQLDELAVVSVGYTVLSSSVRDYSRLQQRLLPHAHHVRNRDFPGNNIAVWGAFDGLGNLYSDQGKPKEAKQTYQRALRGFEKTLGSDHMATLTTINNLGNLYQSQGMLKEAEEMYQRALAGKEKALGPNHTSTLDTANNVGLLYQNQGKLKVAEEMYQRALAGYEKTLGPNYETHLPSLYTGRIEISFTVLFSLVISLDLIL